MERVYVASKVADEFERKVKAAAAQYGAAQRAKWQERVREWMAKQAWLERQMPLVFAVTAGAIGATTTATAAATSTTIGGGTSGTTGATSTP